MDTNQRRNRDTFWIIFINIAVVAAMVVTLAFYASTNSQEENTHARDTLLKSTANMADSLHLYFIGQHRDLNNHRYYISPIDGNNLSYDEAVTYLRKANSDATVSYQIIDTATYHGEAVTADGIISVDYTYETYFSIRKACEIVRAGTMQYDTTRSTASFANTADSAAQSIALYTDITVNVNGQDKVYALLAVIRTNNLVYSGLPGLPYENAGACIIDKNGNYIVKNDRYFRNSENFFKYLRIYNDLTYPQMNAVSADLIGSEDGILEYNDYGGQSCYYSYNAIDGTDGWYYIASVPVASTVGSSFDYFFTLILLFFILLLVTFNGLRMKHLNKLLRSNNKSLDEARRAADAASEAKTIFLAHMSHEIRTPLNAITGMGMLARDRTDNPEVESLLAKMSVASEHLLSVINDVLDISKIGEGKLSIHNAPFSFDDMMATLATVYEMSASEKGISLLFETDVHVDRYLIGDQLRLRQVMTNLIGNALKYNNEGGFVKVFVRRVGEMQNDRIHLHFRVADNGFGISPEKQKDIFEPFVRDYTNKTQSITGTGLGLAISAKLVAAMGGEIKVESALNVGSTFFFELEFALGEPIEHHEDEPKTVWNESSLNGLHILVAEDNEMNAFIVQNILHRVGAQVDLAQNGLMAFEMVRDKQCYDIVLMDILMPELDGYEATRRIRELGGAAATLPIVALSANVFNEDVERSLAHGMQAHLGKPINVDELYHTIIELTGHVPPA